MEMEYDREEMSILRRMKHVLVTVHGWDREDFDGMTFMDIEAEFLDVEEDFRPPADD